MKRLIYVVTCAPCHLHEKGEQCPTRDILAYATDRKTGGAWCGNGGTHKRAIAQAIQREHAANGPLIKS